MRPAPATFTDTLLPPLSNRARPARFGFTFSVADPETAFFVLPIAFLARMSVAVAVHEHFTFTLSPVSSAPRRMRAGAVAVSALPAAAGPQSGCLPPGMTSELDPWQVSRSIRSVWIPSSSCQASVLPSGDQVGRKNEPAGPVTWQRRSGSAGGGAGSR